MSIVAPDTWDPPGLVAAVSETMQINSKWLYGIHCVPRQSLHGIQTESLKQTL